MTVNPLPPQAFTKETLQKAYTWLLNQSASVKDLATSQDMLVSLYLKAQRNGEASLETPSIQNFKQELKNLASMIGDLQTPQPIPAASTTNSYGVVGLTQNFKEATTAAAASSNNNSSSSNNSLGQLDLQSLQILADVKQTLNLSSDIEALRALISLGFKQFKKLNS
jgi:t-SNARE complex subunit (syntaxin)